VKHEEEYNDTLSAQIAEKP